MFKTTAFYKVSEHEEYGAYRAGDVVKVKIIGFDCDEPHVLVCDQSDMPCFFFAKISCDRLKNKHAEKAARYHDKTKQKYKNYSFMQETYLVQAPKVSYINAVVPGYHESLHCARNP